ncbi:MAG: hypothetical protein SVK54_03675, partial [candidate division WOR-3 bacterium]|nr:hypothetical protein [candidate division WOR-3 bacterium]
IHEKLKTEYKDIESKINKTKSMPSIYSQINYFEKHISKLRNLLERNKILMDFYDDSFEETKVEDLFERKIHKKAMRTEKVLNDIEFIRERIVDYENNYSKEFSTENKNLKQLQMIKQQLVLDYSKAKKRRARLNEYKNRIKQLKQMIKINKLDHQFNAEISKLLADEVEKSKLNELEERIIDAMQKDYVERNIKSSFNSIKNKLESKGYEFDETDDALERLKQGDKLSVTIKDDYKAVLRIKDGKFSVRFVKFIQDEKEKTNRTQYEELQEVEMCENWCSIMDNILSEMEQDGFDVDILERIEPSPDSILYVKREEVLDDYQSMEEKQFNNRMKERRINEY